MNKKKLLFIITKSEMGGAQRFLYELITHLDINKYEVLVAAGGNGELFGRLAGKNIKTVKIKNFSNIFGFKNFLVFIEIFRLIMKFNPNVLYLLSSEAGFSGSIAGWLSGKPKIIYRIGGWAFKEPKNILIKKIYFWAEKISAPFKSITITNSEFDRQLGIKNKIAKPEKIITIYNGLDINKLNFLPKEEARKFIESKLQTTNYKLQTAALIGTIANLYKNKGLDTLIFAAAKVRVIEKNWNFIIIGEGPERKNLENLIKKYELENYMFLIGRIPDARRYLKAFNLFVLPSIKEGQPWAILEAMAAEVPIVATNIAGIPETIENEKSGLLVEPADPAALAEAIKKILTHPSLAQECAKNAYLTVKTKFGIDEMIRKNEKLF